MRIPTTVSGRKVSNRGVHLAPHGFPAWVSQADRWVSLLQDMHMSWCVLLSESDAVLKSGAAQALLDGGIIPIVRFAYKFPAPFTEMTATEQLVALYSRYNAPCIIQFANEPFDSREWRRGDVPPTNEAWAIIRDRWQQAAQLITERGAIAGFPDGPCYHDNPFAIIGDDAHLWENGRAVYLGHFYGKGRPLDYPTDPVSWFGQQLSMDEYRAALDDYADDPAWNEGPGVLAMMNEQRRLWADQDNSPLRDDTCWRGWEKVRHWSRETFGFEVQMAMTEGGWVPRDRAGSHLVDIRWPMTTPRKVAQLTLAMFEAESPLFAICPWLLASRAMGGEGWEFDSWVGGAYSERYGLEKPVIQMLQQHAPGEVPPEPEPEPVPEPEPPGLELHLAELSRQLARIAKLWQGIQEAVSSIR